MIEPTNVTLPPSLLFPIQVTGILERRGAVIGKRAPVIRYKYLNYVEEGVKEDAENPQSPEAVNKVQKEFFSTFESPIEGEIHEWLVKVGDEIKDSR